MEVKHLLVISDRLRGGGGGKKSSHRFSVGDLIRRRCCLSLRLLRVCSAAPGAFPALHSRSLFNMAASCCWQTCWARVQVLKL